MTKQASVAPDGEADVADAFDELLSHPRVGPEDEARERSLLSNEEYLMAFADIHGKVPIALEDLNDFERELSRLPHSRKAPAHRGYTVRQARQFLRIEGNDAKKAAKRFARYWEMRERQLGEDAFTRDNTTPRTEDDFRRVYEMARGAVRDAEVDDETRKWATDYISQWNTVKITYLDEEIEKIAPEQKAGLMQAQRSHPDDAATDEHKLLFLRCEDFDAKRAAWRMVSYWKLRVELFGPPTDHDRRDTGRSGAFCPTTLASLMDECPREVYLNFFQVLPKPDDFGRAVFCLWPARVLGGGYEVEKLLKVMWYIFHATLQNTTCSENGAVLVVILKDHPTPFQGHGWWKYCFSIMHLIFKAAPVTIRAVHDCEPPAFNHLFAPVLKWYLGKRLRARYWVHAEQSESGRIMHELETCGISRGLVPTVLGGEFDFDSNGRDWFERRREAEL